MTPSEHFFETGEVLALAGISRGTAWGWASAWLEPVAGHGAPRIWRLEQVVSLLVVKALQDSGLVRATAAVAVAAAMRSYFPGVLGDAAERRNRPLWVALFSRDGTVAAEAGFDIDEVLAAAGGASVALLLDGVDLVLNATDVAISASRARRSTKQ